MEITMCSLALRQEGIRHTIPARLSTRIKSSNFQRPSKTFAYLRVPWFQVCSSVFFHKKCLKLSSFSTWLCTLSPPSWKCSQHRGRCYCKETNSSESWRVLSASTLEGNPRKRVTYAHSIVSDSKHVPNSGKQAESGVEADAVMGTPTTVGGSERKQDSWMSSGRFPIVPRFQNFLTLNRSLRLFCWLVLGVLSKGGNKKHLVYLRMLSCQILNKSIRPCIFWVLSSCIASF